MLGSAAGGGYPQWNCACDTCRRARSGDPAAKPRTQSSLAISADGERWFLLNASPDLRQQILNTPTLYPRHGKRHSPIAGVVLTNGDVDHIAGLINLRESQPLSLYATSRIHAVLSANSIFQVLNPDLVQRRTLGLNAPVELVGPEGPSGITIEMFAVPGKVALYLEDAAPVLDGETEDTVGLRISAGDKSFFYIPGCAKLTPALADRIRGADLLLFDGTLWRDDEMIRNETGTKTGRRMGHMSVSGPEGSLAAFAPLGIRRKVFIHINNTNPILLDDSPERASVNEAGWEVGEDGMELSP
ncbi:pyrroloquinoline quinone biosynthesis protein PqqB [Skermanella stibiiresistens SB22]|uniref:Coenzyme PQQ synthesis protein B n=1 Tax=Skermanella stibiiresistens SB22 TaxID=1385369 RepID=W9GV98_9PROT|nr:pyrroloquinoline quinone biosynthesis protein PqqB [Skermanella stibiiresistens SB22]